MSRKLIFRRCEPWLNSHRAVQEALSAAAQRHASLRIFPARTAIHNVAFLSTAHPYNTPNHHHRQSHRCPHRRTYSRLAIPVPMRPAAVPSTLQGKRRRAFPPGRSAPLRPHWLPRARAYYSTTTSPLGPSRQGLAEDGSPRLPLLRQARRQPEAAAPRESTQKLCLSSDSFDHGRHPSLLPLPPPRRLPPLQQAGPRSGRGYRPRGAAAADRRAHRTCRHPGPQRPP